MDEKRTYAAFGLLAGICVALTALAIYAFASSSTKQETRAVASYEESGVYTYTIASESSPQSPLTIIGPVTAAAADPGAPVTAPAVATDKAKAFDFSYTYELRGEAPDVEGTIGATLELSAGQAWSEKRDLTPPTPFQGPTGSFSASLDFSQIGALLEQVNARTGAGAEEYELIITPVVKVQGSVAGSPFAETFSTPLSITYGRTEITPGDTLGFVENRTITAPFAADREIGLFGPAIEVKTLRLVTGPLAVLALIGAAAMGTIALRLRPPQTQESAPASAQQQPTLVSVASVVSSGGPRISVASLQELEKLARNNTVFVRQFSTDARVYFVHEGSAIYQFAIGDVPEDWVQPSVDAPAVAAATVSPAEPEAAEQIPAWLAAPAEGHEEPGQGAVEPGLEPANVGTEGGPAVMEAAANGEAYPATNGHYPSENGYGPSEAEAEASEQPGDALDESGEVEAEALTGAEEEEPEEGAGEPESVPEPLLPQTRPAYVRNREGAERARAWLKRKYGAGQLGEPVARAGEKNEALAQAEAAPFDIEPEAEAPQAVLDEVVPAGEAIESAAAEMESEPREETIAEVDADEAVESAAAEMELDAAAVTDVESDEMAVEAIIEAEIEAGTAMGDVASDAEAVEAAVEAVQPEGVAEPESDVAGMSEVETSTAEVAAPVSAPEPAAPVAAERTPVLPAARRRRRSLDQQAVDYVRKKLREFLEYPSS